MNTTMLRHMLLLVAALTFVGGPALAQSSVWRGGNVPADIVNEGAGTANSGILEDVAEELYEHALQHAPTRADITVTTIPAAVDYIRTAGYSAAGDGGGGLYEEAAAEPSHDCKVQSADGAWWECVFEDGVVNVRRLGAKGDGSTDDTSAIQSAIDAIPSGGGVAWIPDGTFKTTGTLLLKASKRKVRGPGIIQFVNAAGGTVFAGDSDKSASLATYTYCEIDIAIESVGASTDFSVGVDLTSFSYSTFTVRMQSKRANAIMYYGQGNSGASPYYNVIDGGYLFGGDGAGGTNYTQTGIKFAQGAWAGGSNGPNANIIRGIGRAAALDILVDLQAGLGNVFEGISGESIRTAYFRLNFNAAVDSGTSSGSNGQGTFNDTAKAWTTNEYVGDAVKIVTGTGAGQVRIISTNTATQLSLEEPWGTVPDATSTYEIFESKAWGNQIIGARAEGLASLNPDFIFAAPGTKKTNIKFTEVQALGSGLFVRDDSGSPTNHWFNGSRLVFTHKFENPGASANIDAYIKSSVSGGVRVGGDYVVEWLKVASSTAALGDTATVRLDVGGTLPGGGDMTLTCVQPDGNSICMAMPGPLQKTPRDGTNRGLFLNLQTGAAFSATADLQVTWSVSLF